jgi:hypothetical protein
MITIPVYIPLIESFDSYHITITVVEKLIVKTTFSGDLRGRLIAIDGVDNTCYYVDNTCYYVDNTCYYIVTKSMEMLPLHEPSYNELLFITLNVDIIKELDTLEEIMSIASL